MDRIRQVMRQSSKGKGLAASMVSTFGRSKDEREVAVVRAILLGTPVAEAIRGMVKTNDETGDLLRFLVEQARIDALEASRHADSLGTLFERWVRSKQERLIEQRIMETRSLMVSAILGAVTAMVAALAPVLSSFQLSLTAPAQQALAPYTLYIGILLVVPGAFFLGQFFSAKRAVLNLAVSLAAYLLVVYFFSPLVLSI
jgi:hypothetical protein